VIETLRSQLESVFTVDVEDWFHILDVRSTPNLRDWDALPSRVEKNFRRLLEIFDEAEVKTTCFFLGWVGRKYPHLVREALAGGHEVASHGYSHQLVHRMTPSEFLDDIVTAKRILEDATGRQVKGYRAPGFSVASRIPWYFSTVAEAGYQYDSSIFPALHEHGGMTDSPPWPHVIHTHFGNLHEFPISTVDIMGVRVSVFGGGHLRLAPLFVIERMTRHVLRSGHPVIFYIHPREIDAAHPHLAMGARRRFKSYVNVATTEGKLKRILPQFRFTTFQAYLAESNRTFLTPAEKPLSASAGGYKNA
jgi:polysaccharide deacetylase family protein (PEP-CTERM system associated)